MPPRFIERILVNTKYIGKVETDELLAEIKEFSPEVMDARCIMVYNRYLDNYILVKNDGGEIPENCNLWEIKLYFPSYKSSDCVSNKGKVIILCDDALSARAYVILQYISAIKIVTDLQLCKSYSLGYNSNRELVLKVEALELRNLSSVLIIEKAIYRSGLRITNMKLAPLKNYALFYFNELF
jgi:hypothetical protein